MKEPRKGHRDTEAGIEYGKCIDSISKGSKVAWYFQGMSDSAYNVGQFEENLQISMKVKQTDILIIETTM